jgi:Ca2+-transporting ATPase
MDGPPAQSLGVEPLTKDVMKTPPRDPKVPVITQRMIHKVAVGSVMMLVGTLYVFFGAIQVGQDPHYATTMAFTTFVMFQMFNALNCRNNNKSVFELGFFTNQYFLIAIGGSIIMQIFVICILYRR